MKRKLIVLFAILTLLFLNVFLAYAALTKSVDTVDEWAEVAQNAIREGATKDVSGCYEATLHLQYALSTETAHTGSIIIIETSSNTSGDEDWTEHCRFEIFGNDTANAEPITNDPLAQGSTTATCASTTGVYDDDETHWIFIEDGTVANSELIKLVSHVADTSVTWQDGTTNAHVQNTNMFDKADTKPITLPFSANRVRVIYDNTHDPDGSTIHTKCRLTKVTAL